MRNLYQITEIHKAKIETYAVKMSESELKVFLKNKRQVYGYISGIGGDRNYDCFAVLLVY